MFFYHNIFDANVAQEYYQKRRQKWQSQLPWRKSSIYISCWQMHFPGNASNVINLDNLTWHGGFVHFAYEASTLATLQAKDT